MQPPLLQVEDVVEIPGGMNSSLYPEIFTAGSSLPSPITPIICFFLLPLPPHQKVMSQIQGQPCLDCRRHLPQRPWPQLIDLPVYLITIHWCATPTTSQLFLLKQPSLSQFCEQSICITLSWKKNGSLSLQHKVPSVHGPWAWPVLPTSHPLSSISLSLWSTCISDLGHQAHSYLRAFALAFPPTVTHYLSICPTKVSYRRQRHFLAG